MTLSSTQHKNPTTLPKKCIILGGGISSLASAIRMALKGYKVSVIEKNNYLGGKMNEVSDQGFRFDIGPSIFTLPELADELFRLAGRNPKDYFDYIQLDPVFQYFFTDGTVIHGHHTKEKFSQEIADKTEVSRKTIMSYLEDLESKYKLTEKVFLHSSIHIFKNYFTLKSLKGFLNLRKVEFFRSMDTANKKKLGNDKLKTLFNSFASYIGSNPFKTPATLNLIAHIQIDRGTYFVTTGMATLAKSLVKLAKELGVEFYLNEAIEEISVNNKSVTSVKTSKTSHAADIVISGIDIHQVYTKLLPSSLAKHVTLDQPKSNSALVFLWGMKKRYHAFTMHNMLLNDNQKEEFDAIFSRHEMPADSSIYLYISSKGNPADAPENCENWFVYLKAPEIKNQDWPAIIKAARAKVVSKFNALLGEDIEQNIIYEKILDPIFYQSETAASAGAIYGTQNDGFKSSWKKHANFSSDLKGLYFCGGTVHPGPGVPLALLSAKITTELIN